MLAFLSSSYSVRCRRLASGFSGDERNTHRSALAVAVAVALVGMSKGGCVWELCGLCADARSVRGGDG